MVALSEITSSITIALVILDFVQYQRFDVNPKNTKYRTRLGCFVKAQTEYHSPDPYTHSSQHLILTHRFARLDVISTIPRPTIWRPKLEPGGKEGTGASQ